MRPQTLLVATDLSRSAAVAEAAAIDLAARFDARIVWLHVVEVPAPIFEPYGIPVPITSIEGFRESAERQLAERVARCEARGVTASVEVREGHAVREIVERAGQVRADWVVVGSHGYRGFERWLLGSVAERTAREAPCPVLAVKAELGELAEIVIGVDFSADARAAVDVATWLAREAGARLHLVHALDFGLPLVTPYEMSVPADLVESAHRVADERLDALVAELSDPLRVERHLVSEPAADAICGIAERVGASLVVAGSRGHTGLEHMLLGSVAERTLRLASCSVLVVRPAP